ncbi:hypothetical protein NDU88_003183 [Pleurodeles waltl]|uniref:Uncharacterized protein n=1 Tax=Pleurodeles waltl TaxID=8319 RepID=A0AAV7MXS6_PLEWA|nr:hypothetical protein NDU88_003183 [Pleurodeles waltl]
MANARPQASGSHLDSLPHCVAEEALRCFLKVGVLPGLLSLISGGASFQSTSGLSEYELHTAQHLQDSLGVRSQKTQETEENLRGASTAADGTLPPILHVAHYPACAN